VSIGHNHKASKDETILVWEAISSIKKGLEEVTGSSEADAKFLNQAWNHLPDLVTNLEKL
jgi:hypothetical protein